MNIVKTLFVQSGERTIVAQIVSSEGQYAPHLTISTLVFLYVSSVNNYFKIV